MEGVVIFDLAMGWEISGKKEMRDKGGERQLELSAFGLGR